jgi:hypothetical protein
LPEGTVTRYLADGAIAGAVTYTNQFAGSLKKPRSGAWNVEVQQQARPDLVSRVGCTQRISVREYFVEPQVGGDAGVLWLSNKGRSRYREFQATARGGASAHCRRAGSRIANCAAPDPPQPPTF